MKKLSIVLVVMTMIIGLSSCDVNHFWSSLSGYNWYAVEGVDGYSRYPIFVDDLDYIEIRFSTNGTGVIKFYDDFGIWNSYGFEWDEHRDYVELFYYDGGRETFYFRVERGYLYLSRNPSMNSYTVFRH